MKVLLKNFFSITILFISIYLIYYYLDRKDYITFFTKLSLFEWITISTLGWLIMILTTIITFDLRIPDKKKSIKEIITYPLLQSLWGYLIPFQGSVIFSLFFFKKVHNLSVVKSLSVNLFFLFISFILTGIFGLFYLMTNNVENIYLLFIFILFLLIGFFPYFYKVIRPRFKNVEFRIFKKLFINFDGIFLGIQESFKLTIENKKILSTYVLRLFLLIGWYYLIVRFLNFEIYLSEVIILYLFLELSIILKITPGNWGIQQIIVGFVFTAINKPPEFAIIVTTTALISIFFLTFTIGLVANFFFLKSIKINSLKSIFSKI